MKIAIIGAGISGLSTAYFLDDQHEVHLFEKRPRLGGHAETFRLGPKGTIVDPGFYAFNDSHYPLFNKLLQQLNVEKEKMNFSLRVQHSRLGQTISVPAVPNLKDSLRNPKRITSLLAHPDVYLSLAFYFRTIKSLGLKQPHTPISILEDIKTPPFVKKDYLFSYIYPILSAPWGVSTLSIRNTPIKIISNWVRNHNIGGIKPVQWYRIKQGAAHHIDSLRSRLKNVKIHHEEIKSILLKGNRLIFNGNSSYENFDMVIVAMGVKDVKETVKIDRIQEIFKNYNYGKQVEYIHSDASVLPLERQQWAVYNHYIFPIANFTLGNIWSGHYNDTDFFITYRGNLIFQEANMDNIKSIHHKVSYNHVEYVDSEFQFQNHINQFHRDTQAPLHFVGAYQGDSFHESGLRSAVQLCQRLGIQSHRLKQINEAEFEAKPSEFRDYLRAG